MALIFCPIWFFVSLVKNEKERPGWGIALVRIGIPAFTLGLLWANSAVQIRVAEANSRRVILACEKYHADNGRFPKKLGELVPQYLKFIPRAKYCMAGHFEYHNSGEATLYWVVVPPYLRKIYSFERRRWNYLD